MLRKHCRRRVRTGACQYLPLRIQDDEPRSDPLCFWVSQAVSPGIRALGCRKSCTRTRADNNCTEYNAGVPGGRGAHAPSADVPRRSRIAPSQPAWNRWTTLVEARIRARLALNNGNAAKAIEALQSAGLYELGMTP